MFIRSLKDRLIPPWQMIDLIKKAKKCQYYVDYPVEDGKDHPVWDLNPHNFQ